MMVMMVVVMIVIMIMVVVIVVVMNMVTLLFLLVLGRLRDLVQVFVSEVDYKMLPWSTFLASLFISGFYMYVTSLTGISGSEAVLKSPVYQKSSPTCVFEFYYRMTSTFSETLTLYLNTGSRKTAIWTRTGKNRCTVESYLNQTLFVLSVLKLFFLEVQ